MDYDRLVSRHRDAIYRQMVRVCGNRDDAEDVLAEALLSAYRASDQLSDPENFRAWLATIGRRACGKLKSREALRSVLHLSELQERGVPEPATTAIRQDEQLEEKELRRCVLAAIESLPLEYEEVYRMREVEGVSAEETGRMLGLTVSAVKSRLHRARTRVRKALDLSLCAAW